MKFILYFNFLLLLIGVNAQISVGNFQYENGKVLWQKVYETQLTIEEMKSAVKSLSVIQEIISEGENKITLKCGLIDHDFQALGHKEFTTTIWVARKSSLGNVVYQIKEGRYRVTFTNILLEQEYTVEAGFLTEKKGEQDPIEVYAVRNNKKDFIKVFKSKDHEILDYSYTRVFDLESNVVLDDDF